MTDGTPGVVHGYRSRVLQDAHGQVTEAHSIAAGLDYPGVGPEHAYLGEIGRASYVTVTDDEVRAAVAVSIMSRALSITCSRALRCRRLRVMSAVGVNAAAKTPTRTKLSLVRRFMD